MLFGLLTLLLVGLLLATLTYAVLVVREALSPPRRTTGYALARGFATDPEAAGLKAEHWMLDRPDGAALPVWVVRDDSADLPDLTIVMVHGWGQSRIDMLARHDVLAGLAGRIVLYDLRGHGESTGGGSRLGDGEDADLCALIERLDHTTGPILLVGFSMGGVIAIKATSSASEDVRNRLIGVLTIGAYERVRTPIAGRLHALGMPGALGVWLAMPLIRALGRRSTDLKLPPSVSTRVIVLHGADDRIVPVDEGRRLAGMIGHAEFIEVPGAGHSDVTEKAPEALVNAIRGLLASQLDRTDKSGGAAPGRHSVGPKK